MNLAALSISIDHQDFKDVKARFLKINLGRYIPSTMLQLNSPQVWIENIILKYLQLRTFNPFQARINYIGHILFNGLYMGEFFDVFYNCYEMSEIEVKENEKKLFTITPFDFKILDNCYRNIEKKYNFNEIISWGNQLHNTVSLYTVDELIHVIESNKIQDILALLNYYSSQWHS